MRRRQPSVVRTEAAAVMMHLVDIDVAYVRSDRGLNILVLDRGRPKVLYLGFTAQIAANLHLEFSESYQRDQTQVVLVRRCDSVAVQRNHLDGDRIQRTLVESDLSTWCAQ